MKAPGYIFWFVTLLAAVALGLFWFFKQQPAAVILATPRTEQPMEEDTRFFQRKTFRVTRAGKDFHAPDQNIEYDLGYFWFQPTGAPYPPSLKFPLVLVLHGTIAHGYAARYLIEKDMQVAFPAFIVVPVLQAGWTWRTPKEIEGHPDFPLPARAVQGLPGAVKLIQSLAREYPVDTDRVYVVGCSEGGAGAFDAAYEYSDVFAAAMPISGWWHLGDAPKMTKVPLWVQHGGADTMVPTDISRNMAAQIKSHGGTAIYTEIADMGHDCPSPRLYARPLWQWMFSQKKSQGRKIQNAD